MACVIGIVTAALYSVVPPSVVTNVFVVTGVGKIADDILREPLPLSAVSPFVNLKVERSSVPPLFIVISRF